jgi:hypothetical protein
MREFGEIVLRGLTKNNISSWITGTVDKSGHDFSGWGTTELKALIDDINIPVNGTTVEIAPRTKRIHCHVLIEIKHHAVIHLDIGEVKNYYQRVLPARLKPATGSIYVHVSHVPQSTNYTLEYIRKGGDEDDVLEVDLDEIAKKVYTVQ